MYQSKTLGIFVGLVFDCCLLLCGVCSVFSSARACPDFCVRGCLSGKRFPFHPLLWAGLSPSPPLLSQTIPRALASSVHSRKKRKGTKKKRQSESRGLLRPWPLTGACAFAKKKTFARRSVGGSGRRREGVVGVVWTRLGLGRSKQKKATTPHPERTWKNPTRTRLNRGPKTDAREKEKCGRLGSDAPGA